jgi:hypothetical protein
MTRAEALANWQQGIGLMEKATTVEAPQDTGSPKVNSVSCWDDFFDTRKSEFIAGATLLRSVYSINPPDPPNYAEIEAITEIDAYWNYLLQYGQDYITNHPEHFPIE